ncbi:MAG: HlyD family secretion protein, partial [Treponema sp.]|nr:HlyD family secretion protein [Treponema sp.]
LTIVPEGEMGLMVELYIDPAHIARVRAGQKAVLRFPGLPPSRYGKIETEINLIPADFNTAFGAVPMFVVEAKLEEPWLVSRNGERVYLRAGIGAQARIVIDRDTVFRMLLRKFDFLD